MQMEKRRLTFRGRSRGPNVGLHLLLSDPSTLSPTLVTPRYFLNTYVKGPRAPEFPCYSPLPRDVAGKWQTNDQTTTELPLFLLDTTHRLLLVPSTGSSVESCVELAAPLA